MKTLIFQLPYQSMLILNMERGFDIVGILRIPYSDWNWLMHLLDGVRLTRIPTYQRCLPGETDEIKLNFGNTCAKLAEDKLCTWVWILEYAGGEPPIGPKITAFVHWNFVKGSYFCKWVYEIDINKFPSFRVMMEIEDRRHSKGFVCFLKYCKFSFTNFSSLFSFPFIFKFKICYRLTNVWSFKKLNPGLFLGDNTLTKIAAATIWWSFNGY